MRTLRVVLFAGLACTALNAAAMPVYVDPQLDTDSVSDQHSFLYRMGERAALRHNREAESHAAADAQCDAQTQAAAGASRGAKPPPECVKEDTTAPAPPGKATSAWQTIRRSLPNLFP